MRSRGHSPLPTVEELAEAERGARARAEAAEARAEATETVAAAERARADRLLARLRELGQDE